MDAKPSSQQRMRSSDDVIVGRHPDIARLITAAQQDDWDAQRAASESLLKSPTNFQPAVPGMLTMIASGDERLRRSAADLLNRRAHWISPPNANEFLLPALVKNLPAMTGEPVGDLLVETALSIAPELSDDKVAEIAGVADKQLRNEDGEPLTDQTSMGLLAERLPLLLSPTVGEATRMILEEYRQRFFLKQGAVSDSDAQSKWVLRISMTSLFGQRLIIAGRSRDGNRLVEGRQLADECRRYIETFYEVSGRAGLPDSAGAYHLLFTSALVLPRIDLRTREILEGTKELLEPDLPKASELMSYLLKGRSLLPDVERVVDEFDPSDVEQTLFFTSALMDAIRELERGVQSLELPGAQILDAKLGSVLMKMTDPLLGYFAAELRRVMRKQIPELSM